MAKKAGSAFKGCTLRHPPEHLMLAAAAVAAEENPVNRPSETRPWLVLAALAMQSRPDPIGPLPPLAIAALTTRYWGPSPRTLSVSFLDGGPKTLRRKILAHMNAWAESGCIRFAETEGTGEVRVSRGPGGYWSYLGTDIRLIPTGDQTMNLEGFNIRTPESEYRRVVRHEAGHTLGYVHEHMRADVVARIDRRKAYAYFGETQGWSPEQVDHQVLTPIEQASLLLTAKEAAAGSDRTSIMCYQLPGSITIDGMPIPGGLDLDAVDAAYNARIYPPALPRRRTPTA